jgi:hypothetical protein
VSGSEERERAGGVDTPMLLFVHVAAAYQPNQRDFKLCGTYPVTLLGSLPNVALVDGHILVVFTAKITYAEGEVNVEATANGH